MTPEQATARFDELVRECRRLCPDCAAGKPPIHMDSALADRWFHSVLPDSASMMTPCLAGALRDEMQSIRKDFG